MATDPAVQSALDSEIAGVLEALASAGMRPVHELTPDAAREQLALMTPPPGGPPELHAIEEVSITGPGGTLAGRLYRPLAEAAPATILFFHGGGWVLGSVDGSDALCRTLAQRT